jgi:hypothetical protein
VAISSTITERRTTVRWGYLNSTRSLTGTGSGGVSSMR